MLPGFFRSSLALFWSRYTKAREETISVTVTPAPSRAQMVRKAQSVTPAMGARNRGLSTSRFPIRMAVLSFSPGNNVQINTVTSQIRPVSRAPPAAQTAPYKYK